jgi:immunoglobulin-binding protein 1
MLKCVLQVVRARKHAPPASESSLTDFDLIASLLDTAGIKDDDDEDEDDLREVTLLLLRLTYTQANTQLASISQELELLRGAPREDKRGDQKPPEKEEDNMWRLDNVARGGPDGKGLLLDSKGKVRDRAAGSYRRPPDEFFTAFTTIYDCFIFVYPCGSGAFAS